MVRRDESSSSLVCRWAAVRCRGLGIILGYRGTCQCRFLEKPIAKDKITSILTMCGPREKNDIITFLFVKLGIAENHFAAGLLLG